jgi:hypothetical protein
MNQESDPNQVCILWHTPNEDPTAALVKALSKRELRVMPTTSMHMVFACACQLIKTSKRVVIVLQDRAQLQSVDRILDGLDRFSPEVIVWEYQEGMNPPMVPVVRTPEPARSEAGQIVVPSSPTQHSTQHSTPLSTQPSIMSSKLNSPRSQSESAKATKRTNQPLRLVPAEPVLSETETTMETNPIENKPTHTDRVSTKTAQSGPMNARDVLDADELDALLAGEMGKDRRGK